MGNVTCLRFWFARLVVNSNPASAFVRFLLLIIFDVVIVYFEFGFQGSRHKMDAESDSIGNLAEPSAPTEPESTAAADVREILQSPAVEPSLGADTRGSFVLEGGQMTDHAIDERERLVADRVSNAFDVPAEEAVSSQLSSLPSEIYCQSSLEDSPRAFPASDVTSVVGQLDGTESVPDRPHTPPSTSSVVPVVATSPKLTLKIQRSASSLPLLIGKQDTSNDGTSGSAENHGIRLAALPETGRPGDGDSADDEDERPKLTITNEEPSTPRSSPAKAKTAKPARNARAKPAPRNPDPELDEEELLKGGTEINGFIYYPVKRKRGPKEPTSDNTPADDISEALSTFSPLGRQRRKAALNNHLVRGGHISDDDEDGAAGRQKERVYKPPVKKAKMPYNNPDAKLAKVKASLSTSKNTPVQTQAKTPRIPSSSAKASAHQRLSKKLGLGKRI